MNRFAMVLVVMLVGGVGPVAAQTPGASTPTPMRSGSAPFTAPNAFHAGLTDAMTPDRSRRASSMTGVVETVGPRSGADVLRIARVLLAPG